ncbi:putative DNA-binding transcriptional regulator YafY [Mucilaginibacter yixingensis]|uniref:Putative DNA-binding transcriptional regulator YafY n=1 Tax=Mucilaginibacter yixingensis TaxID=1295612 RepID=A0A2T5J9H5_9SPHI|nr:YafY family protein [Mucilaginibacter yixingensis]PTQ96733.1 putative DNA-binding transcriptional regulator YafY [Mucilaginibacter yixingensis]
MNRIDRISAILIQLQSRRIVKAADIAGRFDISLRTVYRDVNTLIEAGVPIIGEAGVGYSIMEGYRLPPVMFTQEEAVAFLTAEKIVEKLTDTGTIDNYQSAMYKIKAVLRSTEKNMLEDMEQHIEVLNSRRRRPPEAGRDALQPILNGIANKHILAVDYFAQHSQEQTSRKVEPVGIFFSEGYWHMIAFCRLRNDYRDFRVDRIKKLRVTDECFEQQHPTLKEYLAQITNREKKLYKVVLRVHKKEARWLTEAKYYNGFIAELENEETIEMTFLTECTEMFARWYLSFGDRAQIVSPDDLRERVQTLINEILKNVAQPEPVST